MVIKEKKVRIPYITSEDKFKYILPKLKISEVNFYNGTPCWEWQKAKTLGYGTYNLNFGVRYASHREMYLLCVGSIPDSYEIDHLCRNPSCCNPLHLEAVTKAVNTQRGNAGKNRVDQALLITHCPQGHEYNEENTYYYIGSNGNKHRQCKICAKQRGKIKAKSSNLTTKHKTHCKYGHELKEPNLIHEKKQT